MRSVVEMNFIDADSSRCRTLIDSGRLVMVDFWSQQCGPCRSLMPVLKDLAQGHPELTIAKVEIEKNEDLVEEFDVQSIPALLLFKGGNRVDTLIGKSPYVAIERAVVKHA